MTAQDKPAASPAKVVTLGTIARDLRQADGLSRRVFGEQVKLSEPVVKSFETSRVKLTPEQLQRVLRHSAMRDLPARARAAGVFEL